MKKTLRRQRTRRGLKRRVRKNKTMRGGGMWDKLNLYKIDTFKQTGYKFAEQSLLKYIPKYDEILNKAPTIKNEYLRFYKEGMTIDAYDPIEIKTSMFGKLQNTGQSFMNNGAKKGTGVRLILSPSDFNDVLDKIITGWVNKQKFTTTEEMCRKFIDFGLSYTKYMETVHPELKPGNEVVSSISKLAGNTNFAVNAFTDTLKNKIPGGAMFGNLFSGKSNT